MEKIPTILERDLVHPGRVTNQPNPKATWVFAGHGTATRKYDGTCVMLDSAMAWWARREVRDGRPTPEGYVPVSHDPATGKTVGWEPLGGEHPYHGQLLDAIRHDTRTFSQWKPGTFELIGPKVQGNPESERNHRLVAHADADVIELPARDVLTIATCVVELAEKFGYEGIVFHHPDGRMAKIKAKDFTGTQWRTW
jgi:hypothetical protein